jgi:hypothetical protein
MTKKYHYLPSGEMQLATEEERREYCERAIAWAEHVRIVPEDDRPVVAYALAEYMAYQDDKTLFAPLSREDQELVEWIRNGSSE